MNRPSLPGLLVGGGGAESLDDCSNILSRLPREPELAGGGGRDVELGVGENTGGVANFDGADFVAVGALLVSIATGAEVGVPFARVVPR